MGHNVQVGPGTPARGSRECYCKNIITVMTSVSLPTNKKGANIVLLYFTNANQRFVQNKGIIVQLKSETQQTIINKCFKLQL